MDVPHGWPILTAAQAPATRAARAHDAGQLRTVARKVYNLGSNCQPGSVVDATLFGLLVALAAGHSEAWADLEDCLEALGLEGRLQRLQAINGNDLEEVIRVAIA